MKRTPHYAPVRLPRLAGVSDAETELFEASINDWRAGGCSRRLADVIREHRERDGLRRMMARAINDGPPPRLVILPDRVEVVEPSPSPWDGVVNAVAAFVLGLAVFGLALLVADLLRIV